MFNDYSPCKIVKGGHILYTSCDCFDFIRIGITRYEVNPHLGSTRSKGLFCKYNGKMFWRNIVSKKHTDGRLRDHSPCLKKGVLRRV